MAKELKDLQKLIEEKAERRFKEYYPNKNQLLKNYPSLKFKILC